MNRTRYLTLLNRLLLHLLLHLLKFFQLLLLLIYPVQLRLMLHCTAVASLYALRGVRVSPSLLPLGMLLDFPKENFLHVLSLSILSNFTEGFLGLSQLLILGFHLIILDLMLVNLLS